MEIANILVPLHGDAADDSALAWAFALAGGAHVQALFAHPDARVAASAGDLRLSVAGRDAAIAAARERARMSFVEQSGKAGAAVTTRAQAAGTLTASYGEDDGPPDEALAEAARFADLVVFGGAGERGFLRTLMECGKPVLAAAGPARAPGRIALGWDGGIAAARALAAAKPLLRRAAQVELLVIGEPAGIAASKARDYLALAGIAAAIRAVAKTAAPDGARLLEAAKDADLVVMGAYGHHRIVETLFGGTTAHVLEHAGIAVLMAH